MAVRATRIVECATSAWQDANALRNIEEQILEMLSKEQSLTLRELTSRLQKGNTSPLDAVNRLLDEGKISLDKSGIITING